LETVRLVDADIDPDVAVITVLPEEIPVARPDVLIDATFGKLEDQVTVLVILRVFPSE